MKKIKEVWAALPGVAKAFMAGATAAASWFVAAGMVHTDEPALKAIIDAVGNVPNMTLAQWVSLFTVVGAAYGFTWWIPNRSAKRVAKK